MKEIFEYIDQLPDMLIVIILLSSWVFAWLTTIMMTLFKTKSEKGETKMNKPSWFVVLFVFFCLIFFSGIVLGNLTAIKQSEILRPKDSEEILIKLPKDRATLEKQYLINRAQGQILEQMLKWDMYRDEKKK